MFIRLSRFLARSVLFVLDCSRLVSLMLFWSLVCCLGIALVNFIRLLRLLYQLQWFLVILSLIILTVCALLLTVHFITNR